MIRLHITEAPRSWVQHVALVGQDIGPVCRAMHDTAKDHMTTVWCNFNDIIITVRPESNPIQTARDYQDAFTILAARTESHKP